MTDSASLDPSETSESAIAECATCPFLIDPSDGSRSRNNVVCSIRKVEIHDPDQCFCANHQYHSPKADRMPVGPVLRRTRDGHSLLYDSPDRESIRQHLLDIAERVQVSELSQLTFREASALWQLEAFRERRAYVHIDRISFAVSGPSGGLELFEVMLAKGLFHHIVGEETNSSEPDVPLLERLTIWGRMLLLSTLISGSLAFYGLFLFLYENAPAGTQIPLFVLVAISMLAGGAFLKCGLLVFKRMGIPFWVRDRESLSKG